MITEKENTRISKFLSLVLRHQPELIGIDLDENGWTDMQLLIGKMKSRGFDVSQEVLQYVADTNAKKRFSIDASTRRIRANQGHSVSVELGYEPVVPPEILFHGTAERFVDSILASGLDKRERHHVHLSSDFQTAITVGSRHGKSIVLEIASGEMHGDGLVFYLSENNVWLTESVPAKYTSRNEEK